MLHREAPLQRECLMLRHSLITHTTKLDHLPLGTAVAARLTNNRDTRTRTCSLFKLGNFKSGLINFTGPPGGKRR